MNWTDSGDLSRGAPCVIVWPDLGNNSYRSAELRLEEARGLALAIGLDVRHVTSFTVRQPRAATLIGGGQAEALAVMVQQHQAELVVVDGALSAIQQRNLEELLKAKVIDRTGLILEIFGERAATAEGRLQVELAHLDYQAGRLVRSWTHLERQRGGFGFLGGPGETQIEADRRMIRDRMARLRRELEQVRRTRGLHRERRQKAPWPVIALVGYTNAGKSTLFNRLTNADVMAEDLLFATLDPTMRAIELAGLEKAILSDTVGFVSDLPTQLVAAFRATLEEVTSADLIIHVRDISHPDTISQKQDVEAILQELEQEPVIYAEKPVVPSLDDIVPDEPGENIIHLEVWNKWDQLDPDERETMLASYREGEREILPVSALTGEGCDALLEKISAMLTRQHPVREIDLPLSDGARLAWLHRHGRVMNSDDDGEQMHLSVRLSDKNWGRFRAL